MVMFLVLHVSENLKVRTEHCIHSEEICLSSPRYHQQQTYNPAASVIALSPTVWKVTVNVSGAVESFK